MPKKKTSMNFNYGLSGISKMHHIHEYRISDIDEKLRRHMENYSKSMDGLLSLIENQTSFAKQNAKFLRDSIQREENDCFTNVDFLVEHCQKG